MTLLNLFIKIRNTTYNHTPESGEYAIEIDNDTLYLLFQESSGNEDWKNNFDFPVKPYKRMEGVWRVHRGFRRVWKAMQDEVVSKVAQIIESNLEITRIVCGGYSHGGALCLFATEDMTYRYGHKIEVKGFGFGAPRVVWGKIPSNVKERLKNYQVIRCVPDIVTHVPPILLGFRNVNKILRVGEKQKLGPVKAHYPTSYIVSLQALNEENTKE